MQKKTTTELLEAFFTGGLFATPENEETELMEAISRKLIEFACILGTVVVDARFAREAMGTTEAFPVSEIAADYGRSAQAFNKLLRDQGIQYKRGKRWYLYDRYQNRGYTATRLTPRDTGGRVRTFSSMQWTVKGRRFLYDFLREQGIHPTAGKEARP